MYESEYNNDFSENTKQTLPVILVIKIYNKP